MSVAVAPEPRDPLAFDFGINFKSAGERVLEERDDRLLNAEKKLSYCHAFLDDYLRALMPRDLVLLGAQTGAGKTELARGIAAANARRGKRVHYFALEAEPYEIERRTKFSELADLIARRRIEVPGGFNYPDWYCGSLEPFVRAIDDEADRVVAEKYKTLHTYYRGSKFDHADAKRLFLAIKDTANLIVLDHLHYVDIEDDNEIRGFKATVKMIRDVSLGIGIPVILVAHLRKKDQRIRQLVPTLDDFHGASEVVKIATRAIMLAPASPSSLEDAKVTSLGWPTYFSIPKSRVGGACHYLALCDFNWRTNEYASTYMLGRHGRGGDKFEPLKTSEVPPWAKNARQPISETQPHWQEPT